MNDADKDLQQKIEAKVAVPPSVDAKAYRLLFEKLSQDPYEVPVGFSEAIMLRLEKSEAKAFSPDHLWFGIGLSFLIITGIVVTLLLKVNLGFGAFKFISGYGGLFIFCGALIAAFHWIDRSFIRKNVLSDSL